MTEQYQIFTDSSSDLPEEYLRGENIVSMPLSFSIDHEQYFSGEMDPATFYRKMREGAMPATSSVNVSEAYQAMENVLQTGKDILYIGFSAGMSSTLQNVRIAREELAPRYPDCKIMIVDSMSVSLGQGLLVYLTNKMKKAGASLEKATEWATGHASNLRHYITTGNMTHLHRGGRISKATELVGSLLGVQPILSMENGIPKVVGSKRGSKSALQNLAQRMSNTVKNVADGLCFITHTDCEKDAVYLSEIMQEYFDIKRFLIHQAGPVLGAHTGPGSVALFMMDGAGTGD